MEQTEKPSLTIREASEVSGFVPGYLRRLIRQGKLAAHRAEKSEGVGHNTREWRIEVADLEHFVKANQTWRVLTILSRPRPRGPRLPVFHPEVKA